MRFTQFTAFCLATEIIPPVSLLFAIYRGWQQGFSSAELGMFATLCALTLLGIEVGFHRHFSHRSFRAHPWIRAILAALGSMAFQSSVIWWVGIHRTHHKYSDQPLDPHSPTRGMLHAHSGWLFQSANPPRWSRRIKDLLRDPIVRTAHRHYATYVILGLVIPAVVVGGLTQSWDGALGGFLWGGLVRIGVVNHLIWSINSICHRHGNRPYQSRDHSCNNHWLALPTLGFSLHNNHHAFPNSAINAHHWWQIDPSGYLILLLESTDLAWSVNRPSAQQKLNKSVCYPQNLVESL
ncbi:MAG: acyl-CoA desaturase [Cyanobacteria bacterium J06635_1]